MACPADSGEYVRDKRGKRGKSCGGCRRGSVWCGVSVIVMVSSWLRRPALRCGLVAAKRDRDKHDRRM